jgi:hypothetical protein
MQFHCSECAAAMAGTGTQVPGAVCPPAGDTYAAQSLFSNVPRFVILKASPERKLCFRLTVAATPPTGIGISGSGWAVEQGIVTHDAGDCNVQAAPLPPPVGASYPVASGNGTLDFVASPGACAAGIYATVEFSLPPPWVPLSEPLDATALSIVGGCP